MLKRPIIKSLTIFFILMIFTSVIKNESRNLEKDIEKLNIEVTKLQREFSDANIDFMYLSSPEKLRKNIQNFNDKEYLSYDFSKIFLSTDHFLNHNFNKSIIKTKTK